MNKYLCCFLVVQKHPKAGIEKEDKRKKNLTFPLTTLDGVVIVPTRTQFFSSSETSSPDIRTNPPIGNQLIDKITPPIFLPQILGGKPNPNSSTPIPSIFATKKCPNS